MLRLDPPPDLSALKEIVCGGSAVPGVADPRLRGEVRRPDRAGVGHDRDEPARLASRRRRRRRARRRGRALPLRATQGRVVPLVDFTHRRGGRRRAAGPRPVGRERLLRGRLAAGEVHEDGWLRTGDVAEVDRRRYIKLVDRTKDLVKSGGEWISSVELENVIMGHPKVMEAAVIAVPGRAVGRAAVRVRRAVRGRGPRRRRARARSSPSASRSGGSRSGSSSSTRSRRRRSASSTRRSCASASPRRRPPTARRDRLARARAAPRHGRDRAASSRSSSRSTPSTPTSCRAAPARPRSRRSWRHGWARPGSRSTSRTPGPGTRRPNVVGVARGRGGGRSLLLCAHTDTVGVDGMERPARAARRATAPVRPRAPST